jgi:hypothetical protein
MSADTVLVTQVPHRPRRCGPASAAWLVRSFRRDDLTIALAARTAVKAPEIATSTPGVDLT